MKKSPPRMVIMIITFLVICIFAGKCKAQDSIQIDNYYVGLLTNTDFKNVSSAKTTADLRIGAGATWWISKSFQVKAWDALDVTKDEIYSLGMFRLQYQISPKFVFSVGKIPTMCAEIRPLPPTANGHFEAWSYAILPGTKPGAKFAFSPNKNSRIGISVTRTTNDKTEYDLGGNYKSFSGGAYFISEKRYGGTFGIDKSKFTTRVFLNDSIYALYVWVSLNNKGLSIYLDAGTDCSWKILRGEIGLIKSFKAKYFAGLIGAGYADEQKAFKTYLFVYIQ